MAHPMDTLRVGTEDSMLVDWECPMVGTSFLLEDRQILLEDKEGPMVGREVHLWEGGFVVVGLVDREVPMVG